jgi:DNA polymerase (family 10)
MRNDDIAAAFDELADRLALTDAKPYRYMAYRRAATTFRELTQSAALLSEEGRLREIDGVGEAIDEKVRELIATGTFPALERARADVDDTLLALVALPGIGPATARKVYAELDGESFDSLLERARLQQLEPTGGLTTKVISALVDAAAAADDGSATATGATSGIPRDADGRPLPGPWFRRDQVQALELDLEQLLPSELEHVRISGSYARGRELADDVRIVATGPDPTRELAAAIDTLGQRGWEITGHDETPSLPLLAPLGAAVATAQAVSPAGMPVILAVATADAADRAYAALAGPDEWPLEDQTTPIELRDRVLAGVIAAADVPTDLVQLRDLRGELHAHSDWSDGRATILEMARAARARGDEYFAVTDHSAPYAMVGGLDPARIAAQADEIARANETLQREHEEDGAPLLRVLRGTELEILADGTLGLPDSVLAQLDWVVASLHVQQRQSADAVRERMRPVLENPLVDAIGHPTSRRLLKRERTALDVDWLIEQSLAHDVVLEINANPDRLDLDSDHAGQAAAAGVRITINTDAHRPATLALRQHGVAIARRAAIGRSQVVNCLDLDALLAGRRRNR